MHARTRLFVLVSLAGLPFAALAPGCSAGSASEGPTDPGGDDGPACIGKCDAAGDVAEDAEYEYVVVGSGAGGGPLASNLARAGHSVLLLEAGEDVGQRLTYQVPAFHTLSTEDATMQWDYHVSHYPDASQAARDSKMVWNDDGTPRGILYPRAGTLGGCTSHNAMITVTPHDSDWQHLAEVTGDPSWSPEAMRPYFAAVERNGYLAQDTPGHGFDGWLSVERPDVRVALLDARIQGVVKGAVKTWVRSRGGEPLESWFDSIDELVHLMDRDPNGPGAGEGLYTIPLATRGGRRNGTRERILDTAAQDYPLTVRTRSLVTRVLFADEPAEDGTPRAIGVEFLDGRSLYRADPRAAADGELPASHRARATREVILAAGAFNTPQLLMLSGIGPREQLEPNGIPVRVELPGVGRNLQDRYEVGVVSELDAELTSLRNCRFGASGTDRCLSDWRRGRGPYTSNGGVVSLVVRSRVAEERGLDPDLFVFAVATSFRGYYPGYSAETTGTKRHVTWAVLKGHTENQAGTVTLRSGDPRDTPIVDFNYFEAGTTATGEDVRDLEAMVEGVELVRDIIRTTDEQPFLGLRETFPGPGVATREQIAAFVRDEAWGHHASCSARIGADGDPMAVLDARFRVRGTTGLRVVDASVFPRIPGFFIVVPVYMISEKASVAILEDAASEG